MTYQLSSLVLLSSCALFACGSDSSSPAPTPSEDQQMATGDGVEDASVSKSDAATTRVKDAGVAADSGAKRTDAGLKADDPCNPATSADLEGCACTAQSPKRACYTGPAATRNTGMCKDGTQSCDGSGGEFGMAYGPCTGDSLPGPQGCNPPVPDAGVDPCKQVSGMNGMGKLPDGTMFCEDDLGGILGGFFGP